QTTNGIYDVQSGTWTRSPDFDSNDDVVSGTRVNAAQGNTQIGQWVVNSPDPVRITRNNNGGITNITFVSAFGADYTLIRLAFPITTPSLNIVTGLIANDSSSVTKTANKNAIQSAIDAAYTAGLATTIIPAGVYYCDPGIYLDPPLNLRVNINSPSIFAFS